MPPRSPALAFALAALGAAIAAPVTAGEKSPTADVASMDLHVIRMGLLCGKAPAYRRYCEALDAFEKGKPLGPSRGKLVGGSLEVLPGLGNMERLAWLVTAGSALDFVETEPRGEAERRQARAFLDGLARGESLGIADPLLERGAADVGQHRKPWRVAGRSSLWTGRPNFWLRDTGDEIVAIESQFKAARFRIAVFPKVGKTTGGAR